MKQGITREFLVEEIKSNLDILVRDQKRLDNVANQLFLRHDIEKSLILNMADKDNDYMYVDIFELGLIGYYLALELGKDETWLTDHFNESEIIRLKAYKAPKENKTVKLEFDNAIRVSDNLYYILVHWTDLAKWMDNGIFIWDERVQREGIKRQYGDKLITLPKINMSNIKEIKKKALEGRLMCNELAYNILLDSSGESQDLYYDFETGKLKLADRFIGHIVDGYHRTSGIHRAWMENTDIDGYMIVRLSNYDLDEAAEYQVEQAKATPVDKSKIESMNKSRMSNRIVDKLMKMGYLKGKISKESRPNRQYGEIVSYKVLSDALFETLEKKGNLKVTVHGKKLDEYLTYLFENFAEDYYEDNTNYLFKNQAFYWHIVIFNYILDKDLDMMEVTNIIKPKYFNKDLLKNNYGIENLNISDSKIKSKKYGLKMINDMISECEGKEM